MAFNQGFQTNFILNSLSMPFHPVKVALKVFKTLFKTLSAHCAKKINKSTSFKTYFLDLDCRIYGWAVWGRVDEGAKGISAYQMFSKLVKFDRGDQCSESYTGVGSSSLVTVLSRLMPHPSARTKLSLSLTKHFLSRTKQLLSQTKHFCPKQKNLS